MLSPGDRNEGTNASRSTEIEEPARGNIINANEVDACFAHHIEIAGGFLWVAEMLSLRIGREGTIGHTLDEKLFITLKEELCAHAHGLHINHRGDGIVGLRQNASEDLKGWLALFAGVGSIDAFRDFEGDIKRIGSGQAGYLGFQPLAGTLEEGFELDA